MVDWDLVKRVFGLKGSELLYLVMIAVAAISGFLMQLRERSIVEWAIYILLLVLFASLMTYLRKLDEEFEEKKWRERVGLE